ncbi:galactokinase family protein [Gracilinema caldarium]|uniref:galactokinase n=1 Tax=Gracilinema caldarium TaxID=215591 RepID=UPI0026F128DB|nr:galactokinase family protein [Gracilinema caldarium]
MKDIGSIHLKEYEADIDGSEPVMIAESPGRLHLMGEHGEPGASLLLSTAINRHVRVAISHRKDSSLRFFAADLGERKRTTLINLKYKREDRWANFIKMAIHGFAEWGYPIKGLNCTLTGNIPQQVSLASSSAIEVASALALRALIAPDLSDKELLNLLSEASFSFFGRNEHPLDHLIALSSKQNHFLVVDELDMSVRHIPLPFKDYKILITDSRVPRFGVDTELKQRNRDIRKGLEMLSHKREGATFRDYVTEDLMESMGALPEEIRRRSLHVVKELRRIYDAEEALKKSDLNSFAKAVYHSHESLRDLLEVSCPEIDWLIKRSGEINGVLCSRMTGQGFGGCTYTIIKTDAVDEYTRRLEDYERIFGFKPIVHEVSEAGPASLVHSGALVSATE